MALKINGLKTASQNLIDLIKEANPAIKLESNQVTFSDATGGVAATVTTTGVDGEGYSGSVDVIYDRITFSEHLGEEVWCITLPDLDMDGLRLELGRNYNIVASDLTITTEDGLPTAIDQLKKIVFEPISGDLIYQDDAVPMEFWVSTVDLNRSRAGVDGSIRVTAEGTVRTVARMLIASPYTFDHDDNEENLIIPKDFQITEVRSEQLMFELPDQVDDTSKDDSVVPHSFVITEVRSELMVLDVPDQGEVSADQVHPLVTDVTNVDIRR